jgi:hypothetical protein
MDLMLPHQLHLLSVFLFFSLNKKRKDLYLHAHVKGNGQEFGWKSYIILEDQVDI